MVLRLDLPPELERRLQQKARANGMDPSRYALKLIAEDVNLEIVPDERRVKSLREILGMSPDEPDAAEIAGMTDDEVGDFLEEIKHNIRRERREAGLDV